MTLDARLDELRGCTPALHHTARTLAALTQNPRCARRGLLDAAGADKNALAAHLGFEPRFGQSQFALARARAFEARVKADGCAELLRVLRETLALPLIEVAYDDLETVGSNAGPQVRHARTRTLLSLVARGQSPGTLFDHPLLRLTVAGHQVYLEPDLIAFRVADRFYIVEIRAFPIIDEQADSEQVKSATTQAAAYVIALRALLAEFDLPAETVSDTVVLVAPRNFTNTPTGAFIDARKEISTLQRQLRRIDRIDVLLDTMPAGLTFDLHLDADGVARRPRADLARALDQVEANYRPDCLAHCELGFYCRHQARAEGSVDVLGPTVREHLGGIDTITMALALADGATTPTDDQIPITQALRHAAHLRDGLQRAAA